MGIKSYLVLLWYGISYIMQIHINPFNCVTKQSILWMMETVVKKHCKTRNKPCNWQFQVGKYNCINPKIATSGQSCVTLKFAKVKWTGFGDTRKYKLWCICLNLGRGNISDRIYEFVWAMYFFLKYG